MSPIKTYTPLISEVLTKVHNAKTKDKKIAVLQENNTNGLRAIIKSSFDPSIEWSIPQGPVPYMPNEVPEGVQHTFLEQETRILWHFIKGADTKTTQPRKEHMFVQMLEGLHEDEAKVVCWAKDKILHQKYKGLSDNVVKEAFGWDENYRKPA